MQYLGEIISLGVAFSWTIAAMSCEVASKRLGVVVTNVWRMGLALALSVVMMWWFTGEAFPVHAGLESWVWLLLSGVVGYFFGDWCLFNSYIAIRLLRLITCPIMAHADMAVNIGASVMNN